MAIKSCSIISFSLFRDRGKKGDLGVFYTRALGLGITNFFNFLLVQSAKGGQLGFTLG
jgi:hypothetical protein